MHHCAYCRVFACESGAEERPGNCPMKETDLMNEVVSEYRDTANRDFFIKAAEVEGEGYGEWNRVREIIELSKKMGYHDIGVAFCVGLKEEAKIFSRILEERGFTVHSVACKNGANDKCEFGIAEEAKVEPGFEPACNPIGQAKFLAEENVDFAVVLGLCVGHDSLFYKYFNRYSDAFCTTLVVKDRALGHNPAVALYQADGYMENSFGEKKK